MNSLPLDPLHRGGGRPLDQKMGEEHVALRHFLEKMDWPVETINFLIGQMDCGPEQYAKQCDLLLEQAKISLEEIKKANSTDELNRIVLSYSDSLDNMVKHAPPEYVKQLTSLKELLNNRVLFEFGSKNIDLNINDDHLKIIIQRFYRDESHPMDLQRYFRHPEKSVVVFTVINNLVSIPVDSQFSDEVLLSDVPKFNEFLVDYLQSQFEGPHPLPRNLVEVPTVPAQLETIRRHQQSYYQSAGIEMDTVSTNFTFSLPDAEKGIVVFDSDYVVPGMGDHKRFEHAGYTYLRVPDAGNKIVRISNRGYEALEKLQERSSQDLIDVVNRLDSLFSGKGHIVTAVKSKFLCKFDFSYADHRI